MTFNPNIPNSIRVSQSVISNNFNTINSQFRENHVELTSSETENRGKHSGICFVQQGADPAVGAGECLLYTKDTGGAPQLYKRDPNGIQQFSAGAEIYSPLKVEAFVIFDRNGNIFSQKIGKEIITYSFNVSTVDPGPVYPQQPIYRYDSFTVNFTNPISTQYYLCVMYAFWSQLQQGVGPQRTPVLNITQAASYSDSVSVNFLKISSYQLIDPAITSSIVSIARIGYLSLTVYTVQL